MVGSVPVRRHVPRANAIRGGGLFGTAAHPSHRQTAVKGFTQFAVFGKEHGAGIPLALLPGKDFPEFSCVPVHLR